MDLKDSAAGDYREGEMLAAGGIIDKEPCKKEEEEMITGEQFGMELCDHPNEQNIVASEKKDIEDHSLAYRDELPSTVVENKEYEDHSLANSIELPSVVIETEDDEDDSLVHRDELPAVSTGIKDDEDHYLVHIDEMPAVSTGSKDDEDHYLVHIDEIPYLVHRDDLPSVTIGSKDDDDHSPDHTDELPSVTIHTDELPAVTIGSKDDDDNSTVPRDELPTDVLENNDQQLHGLGATDVNNFTVHSCQVTSHNEEEQLTNVICSTHSQLPSPPNDIIDSSEEQPFVASRNEDKYIVAGHPEEEAPTLSDQQSDHDTVANGNTDRLYGGDGCHFGEQVIVAYIF